MPNKESKTKKPFNKKSSNGRNFGRKDRLTQPGIDPNAVSDHEKPNDVSWYSKNPQLLKDSCSLPFSQMAGLSINWPGDRAILDPIENPWQNITYLPGIAVISLEQSTGIGTLSTDAPTIAARNVYTYIRHANSGSANYEAPDLMMMIMAYSSASSWLAELRRAYGLLRVFTAKNRYFGESLIKSLGFDWSDLVNHMADFRAYINIASNKLNSIKIPKGLTFADRWKWCSSSLYSDDDSVKSQIYAFKFDSYLKYSGFTESTGTELIRKRFIDGVQSGEYMTLAEIKAFTDDLIDVLYYDEDVGIMSGDIMKAFKESVTSEPQIDESYTVIPDYNTDVLMQIHNMLVFGPKAYTWNTTSALLQHTIKQDAEGAIVEDCFYEVNASDYSFSDMPVFRHATGPVLLDAYTDNVSPELVMEMTRLIPVYKPEVDENGYLSKVRITNAGTEIPLGILCVYHPLTGGNLTDNSGTASNYLITTAPDAGYYNDAKAGLAITAFNWHPIQFAITPRAGTVLINVYETGIISGVVGDLENYSLVSQETIANIHRVAVLSEFAYTDILKL